MRVCVEGNGCLGEWRRAVIMRVYGGEVGVKSSGCGCMRGQWVFFVGRGAL